MTPRRFVIVGLLWALTGGCGEPAPCFSPYEPSGPAAASHCDCPDGILYFCSGPDTCGGQVGRTSCEPAGLDSYIDQRVACEECTVHFTDVGAVFVVCDPNSDDSAW